MSLKLLALALLASCAFGQIVGVTDLSNTQLQSVCFPDQGMASGGTADWDNYPFNSLCGAQYNTWSSGAVDTLRSRLLIKGGGHSDYHGNDVEALYYATTPPTMARINDPDKWCNNGFSGNTSSNYCGAATLASAVTSTTQTGISVNTPTGTFPGPPFVAVIPGGPGPLVTNENMLVTTVTGSSPQTWTVVRGYAPTGVTPNPPSTYPTGTSISSPGIAYSGVTCPGTDAGSGPVAPGYCFVTQSAAPVARHTFNCLTYLPTQDAMFSFEGTYPSGTDMAATWWLQFSGSGSNLSGVGSATWVAKDPVNALGTSPLTAANPSGAGATCVYDPSTDTVLVGQNTAGDLWRYTPSANRYDLLTSNVRSTAGFGGNNCEVVPSTNQLFCMGTTGNGVNANIPLAFYTNLNGLDGYVSHDITTLATAGGCNGMMVNPVPGLRWDSYTSRIVGYPGAGGNTVYVMDPSTLPTSITCSSETLGGYPIPAPLTISGTGGKFAPWSGQPGQFLFCGGGGASSDCVQMGVDGIAPTITSSATLTTGTQDSAYSFTAAASGSPAITWSITSGALPTGISLNASTGVIAGTPTVGGTFTFTLTATNAYGSPSSQPATVTINPVCLVTVSVLPIAQYSLPYSQYATTAGCDSPVFSWTGTTPPGLSLNTTTGLISGTPTATGSYSFTVSIADANGNPSQVLGLVVVAGPGVFNTLTGPQVVRH